MWAYKVSEEIAPVPPRRFYVWGRIDNTKIRFHVVPSRDDMEKRLRCKLIFLKHVLPCQLDTKISVFHCAVWAITLTKLCTYIFEITSHLSHLYRYKRNCYKVINP